jgi:hypothetical protein
LAVLWQPLPQVDHGKEDLGLKKEGELPHREDPQSQVLARLSKFFYLRLARVL